MAFFRKLAERRLLILVICLVIIGYCVHKLVFVPVSVELDSVRAKTSDINNKIAELPVKIHDLRRLRDDYAQVVSDLESINSKVTSEAALPYFVKELEDVSKEAGTEISSVSVGALTAGFFYSKIPITVSFQGSYRQVRHFVQGLTRLGRAFRISDLRLESSGSPEPAGPGEEHILNAAFSMVVYIVPKGGDS